MAEELFQDTYHYHRETKLAVMLSHNGDPDDKDDVFWIPKSVLAECDLIGPYGKQTARVTVKEWWAKKQGLT